MTKVSYNGHSACYISIFIEQGKRRNEVLSLCGKWSFRRGHTDFEDRAFFPSPRDVKYIEERRKARRR